MKALIFRNKVVQVEDATFPVSQEMKWRDCPKECKHGWILDGEELKEYQRPQKELDAEQARKDRIAAIESAKAEIPKIKAERTGNLTMNYLDKRLSAIETILGL